MQLFNNKYTKIINYVDLYILLENLVIDLFKNHINFRHFSGV